MYRLLVTALLLAAVTWGAGCSAPRSTADAPEEEAEELPTPAANLADYEDFDPSPYREAAPAAAREVTHDVPDRLMGGRATGRTETTVQGYRVQIFSTLDKSAAVQAEEDLGAWWSENREEVGEGILPDELPIYTVYMQPYYRVRVGNFTSREAAAEARNVLAQRFEGAFVVPDAVNAQR